MTYILKRSRRAKYMRLSVRPGGSIVITAPERLSLAAIERFLATHTEWIDRAARRMQHLKPLPAYGRRAYLTHRESARALVHERLAYWNTFYSFKYNRIAIKNTESLWGSCSRKGNLNFSYALVHLPPMIADYVIVHELCHLQEHNHGPRFWALVAQTLPDYRALKRELARYSLRQ